LNRHLVVRLFCGFLRDKHNITRRMADIGNPVKTDGGGILREPAPEDLLLPTHVFEDCREGHLVDWGGGGAREGGEVHNIFSVCVCGDEGPSLIIYIHYT